MDPTEFGAGSAAIDVSHAVKASGGQDLWAHTAEEIIADGLETVQKPNIKVRCIPDSCSLGLLIGTVAET
jgi:nucleolar protein 53